MFPAGMTMNESERHEYAARLAVERAARKAELDESVAAANERNSQAIPWTPRRCGGYEKVLRNGLTLEVSLSEFCGSFSYQWAVVPTDSTQHMAHCEDTAVEAIVAANWCACGWGIGRQTAGA